MLMMMPKWFQLPPLLLLAIMAFPSTPGEATKVEEELKNKIANAPAGATWQVFVFFKSDENVYGAKPNPTEEAHISHYNKILTLQKFTKETQAKAMSKINTYFAARTSGPKDVEMESYWLMNGIYIDKASKDLIDLLGDESTPENENITEIVENSVWILGEKSEEGELTGQTPNKDKLRQAVWATDDINARAWWDKNWNGTGVIVGHIDTGVDIHHSSLKWNWMGKEEGWRDVIENTTTLFPFESDLKDSHGTQTLGALAGRGTWKPGDEEEDSESSVEFFGVGVAPGARWMSCRACIYNSTSANIICQNRYLAKCMEFMHCPNFDNKCYYHPNVVSVSLGCDQNATTKCKDDRAFDTALISWRSDGIIPVFAAGNEGQMGCVTVTNVGQRKEVISVGSHDKIHRLDPDSSKGPPTHKYSNPEIRDGPIFKPDLVAPGMHIYSTLYVGEKSILKFGYGTGTSMAAPHVAGAIALLLSRNRELTFDRVKEILLNRTRSDVDYFNATPRCGNPPLADDVLPNFKWGYGRLRLPFTDDTILPVDPSPPTKMMPPPPDFTGLSESTKPAIPARMMPMITILGAIAYRMNSVMLI